MSKLMTPEEKGLIASYQDLIGLVDAKFDEMTHAGHLHESYLRLFEAVAYVYSMGVRGEVLEFGSWTGKTSVVIAQALKLFDEKFSLSNLYDRKRAYFCDSFTGLPEITSTADESSIHVRKGIWQEGAMVWQSADSLEKLIGGILPADSFDVIAGFFAETVEATFASKRIAMVHCDVDLHSSTVDCLEPLFRLGCLAHGSIILFDDWNCSAANPEHGQRKAFAELCETFAVQFSDEGRYSYHGRAVIIQNYRGG
jgi:hypothetical protein